MSPRCLLALLALPFLGLTTPAQITNVTNDQATPIPGAGHDYIKMLSESVEPASGQVSVRIDEPTRPGRGITLPVAFLYDSAGVHHVIPQPNGKAMWISDTADSEGSGWSTSGPTLSAIRAIASTAIPGPPP